MRILSALFCLTLVGPAACVSSSGGEPAGDERRGDSSPGDALFDGGDERGGDEQGGDPVVCGDCAPGALACRDGDAVECVDDGGCLMWTIVESCSGFQICLDADCVPASCSTGDSVLCDARGICAGGRRYCTSGQWGDCSWSSGPEPEVCDGLDNDCNGAADDGLELGPCPDQDGACAGSRGVCLGSAGVTCDATTYAEHAATGGEVYEPGDETRCDGVDNDCDGAVDEMVATDPLNCGDCERSCEGGLPCSSGNCGCSGDGDCAAGEICAAGTCGCADQSHRCGGACVPNDDPATCGDRCDPCPAPPDGSATCDGATCGTTCSSGFEACADQCIPTGACSLCVPCAPTGLTASAGDHLVVLNWLDRSRATLGPFPESSHPYANGVDETRTYTLPGAQSLSVTFDSQTSVEEGWEQIHVVDGGGTAIAGSPFTGTELAGVTVSVPGNAVRVRLTSGSFVTDWGYRVTRIVDERGSGAVESYRLYWRSGAGTVTTGDSMLAGVTSPTLHTGRTNGTTYRYRLAAVGSADEGPLSSQVEATPAAGASTYTVGGTVTGLFGTDLVVQLNGGEALVLDGDGSFAFATELLPGQTYAVSVASAPRGPSQVCTVADGAGSIGSADVTNVEVACSLQIATFNLKVFDSTASATKKAGIAGVILDNDFDLVAIQEVSDAGFLSTWIAQYLGTTEWGYRLGTSGGDLRNGFLYRRKVVTVTESGELDSTRSGGYINAGSYPWGGLLRVPYWARIEVPGTNTAFDLVVIHFKALVDDSSCDIRAAQVEDVAAWILNEAPPDVVVLGDFNDQIAGTGNCSSVDTLSPMEILSSVVFVTKAPTYLANGYYTYPAFSSVIDHIVLDTSTLSRLYEVDASGHVAGVVVHGSSAISDHQPPYVWLGFE